MNPSLESLWQRLREDGIVEGELTLADTGSSPWYVKLLLAFCGWFAALFVLGFIAIGFEFILKNSYVSFTVGMAMIAAAFLLMRQAKNEFIEHLSLAISLVGQALIIWTIFESNGSRDGLSWLLLACLQAGLAWLMPSFVHRVFSSFLAVYALILATAMMHIPYLVVALVTFSTAWLWINEYQYTEHLQKIRAIAYGLTLSLLYVKGGNLYAMSMIGWRQGRHPDGSWTQSWIPELITTSVVLYVVWQCLQRLTNKPSTRTLATILICTTLVCLVSLEAQGITLGMMIIILGFYASNRVLTGLGLISLIFYISSYYYLLNATLLEKSQTLLVTGVVLLFIRWFLIHHFAQKPEIVDE